MADDKHSHPVVRSDDRRVTMDERTLACFKEMLSGEMNPDHEKEFKKQLASGKVKVTNKELIWLRDNHHDELRMYFEALEMRVALGWEKPPTSQMKAMSSLEQRMGWRDARTGRLKEAHVKKRVDGRRFDLEVKVREAEEPIDVEFEAEENAEAKTQNK